MAFIGPDGRLRLGAGAGVEDVGECPALQMKSLGQAKPGAGLEKPPQS